MNKPLALSSGLLVLALTGCSSQLDNKTASGNFDYLDASQRASVKVPEGLDKPEFTNEYELPPLGPGAAGDQVGKNLFIDAPALVLPLVTGSHVQEGKQSATVMFDQVDDSQPLEQSIWNTLLEFLDTNNIGVAEFDKEKGILVTDWINETHEDETAWYDFTDGDSGKISTKYEFSLDVKAHGRSAALNSKLIDFKASGNSVRAKTFAQASDMVKRREEVNILNDVITYYEYQIRLDESKRIAKIRQGLGMEMGFDSDGSPAYVVDAQYDVAWPRLLLVLRKMGFDVKDLDKSTGLLFVTYTGNDSGWWGSLFSSDEDILEKGDYRLKVRPSGDSNTTITFMNDESEPFEPNQVADMFDKFAQVMSEDNLDI